MGVKFLWTFLEPYAERKPLSELNGKTVCVDLSGWVCESMNITDYKIQPKMYLKHLFFRTSYLILANITPIFIAEGETPALKYQVIAKRNEIQFPGARPRAENPKAVAGADQQGDAKALKGRTRFNYILKQCEELITCLGIQTIIPPGEAEAYGAYLSSLGLVDGVISQDSDCFAYGARRVFRNFSVSQASGAMVDVYDIERINSVSKLDFGQDKIIAMALFCGCDYCPDGVQGVGKDGALKVLMRYSNSEILNVLQGWRYEQSKYDRLYSKSNDSTKCNNCGHFGKQANHTRKGCPECKTSVGCTESSWKEDRLAIKNELQIREKALKLKDFPSTQIIHEFKKKLEPPKSFDRSWRQPNIIKFVKVMGRQLEWREIYAFQKVFPLLTRWQLQQKTRDCIRQSTRGFVEPAFIKKKRNPRAMPCYEIIWKDEHKYFSEIFPDEQLQAYLVENDNNLDSLWTTIEPADLVDRVYPHLIEEFEAEKLAKKKKPKTTKRANKSPSQTTAKTRKPKKCKPSDSLNDFSAMQSELEAIAVVRKPAQKKAVGTLDKFLAKHATTPQKPIANSSLLAAFPDSDVDGDCENDMDLSNLISDIVSRSPTIKQLHGHRLIYQNSEQTEISTSPVIQILEKATVSEDEEKETKNQSLDDIDLMIMRKKTKNPRHIRRKSLRMELLSSTPNRKSIAPSPVKLSDQSFDKKETSFFSPAGETDDFESSYNALISAHHQDDGIEEIEDSDD